ncbi:hypothetical protein CC80DRAFT_491181 [Byssothecium circinans]|uniref:Uncharacterized protein n=1 Tax=Byssothecium circinans TaxID=147558 RepID=A0A6A5TZF9_9PLEO|nr:hypothetical protein CC80DRAFT_491181 [Byssothecium circinans]
MGNHSSKETPTPTTVENPSQLTDQELQSLLQADIDYEAPFVAHLRTKENGSALTEIEVAVLRRLGMPCGTVVGGVTLKAKAKKRGTGMDMGKVEVEAEAEVYVAKGGEEEGWTVIGKNKLVASYERYEGRRLDREWDAIEDADEFRKLDKFT